MARDPAFLFYPGDYLRDTQCLSPNSQAAYDRIMCEHMRNICISQQQLNFFTKRLSEGEKEELMMVLTKNDSGFQIDWVVDSITKRKAYSESRSNNRAGKSKKDMNNTSLTYDKHMEIENEIENKVDKEDSRNGIVIYDKESLISELQNTKWIKDLALRFKLDDLTAKNKLNEFADDLKLKSGYKRNLAEIKTHFFNVLNKTKNNTPVVAERKIKFAGD